MSRRSFLHADCVRGVECGGAGPHRADAAIGRIRTTEQLYAFSRKLAGTGTLDDVLWATAYQIALMLKVRVVLLLPDEGLLTVKSGYPPEDDLDQADLAAANWPRAMTGL